MSIVGEAGLPVSLPLYAKNGELIGHIEYLGIRAVFEKMPFTMEQQVRYDVKLYDPKIFRHKHMPKTYFVNYDEAETVRDLKYSQKTALVAYLKRNGIKHLVKEVTE